LIDIETDGRQVERKMIELNPERVMNMLPQFSVQIRNLALKALKGQSLLAILGIDAVTLQKISLEIEDFGKVICAPDDLSRYLQTLCDFLGSERFLQINSLDLTLDQRLMIFVQRIQNFFKPEVKLEDKGGYEQMLKRVQLVDDESEYQSQQGLIRNYPSGLHAYRDSVLRDLHQIIELLDVQSEIKTLMQSFEEMKSWMIRAADLQTEQGERMMKYQVMLEKRLSSAIGELLEYVSIDFL
jgi:hypothetical protein